MGILDRISEGFVAGVGERLRKYYDNSPEKQASALAKGNRIPYTPTSGYSLFGLSGDPALAEYLHMDADIVSKYADFAAMEDVGEISQAIDTYGDDSTQPETSLRKSVWINCRDKQIQKTLEDMFKYIKLEDNLQPMARSLCKYGGIYFELLINQRGVVGLNYLRATTMRRIQGQRGELKGFIQDTRGRIGYTPADYNQALDRRLMGGAQGDTSQDPEVTAFEPYEIVHMRLQLKDFTTVYGTSVLEPARHIWRRMFLLQDAALLYRIRTAPERYAFYIDIGGLPPNEAKAELQRFRQEFSKRKYIDPATGQLALKFEALAQEENFYLPVRNGAEAVRVETLGAPSWQSVDDLNWFNDRFFAALKIPKSYFNSDEIAKQVLSSQDIRFARSILRIQKELKKGLYQMCNSHLAAIGLNPDVIDYEIEMTVPSSIYELAQLEVRNARADLAQRMDGFVSKAWMLENIFGFSNAEIKKIFQQRSEDSDRQAEDQARAEAIVQQSAAATAMQAQQAAMDQGLAPEQLQSRRIILPKEVRHLVNSKPVRGWNDQELMEGSRVVEKKMAGSLDRLLANDKRLATRLMATHMLLQDLRTTLSRSPRSSL